MRVADVMTRDVMTITMDASIDELRSIFEVAPFHHLAVVEKQHLMGVVSDRDLLKNLSPFLGNLSERGQDVRLLNRRVHQIMTRSPITASPDEALADAARRMLTKRVSCLPVVDSGGRFVGIVTIRDVARWAVDRLDAADTRNEAA